MRHTSRLILFITAAIVFAAASVPAGAAASIYAGKRKTINCGVVVVDRAKQPLAEVGNLFFLLDRRADLKPAGWSLDNPLSPFSASTGLGKDNPAYWEVDLSAASGMARMHVLYFPASGTIRLTDQQRETLRKFVDGGGVLWIDNTSGGNVLAFNDTFFIPKLAFNSVSGMDVPADRFHPLVTTPYWLGDAEVSTLGALAGKADCNPGYNPSNQWDGMEKPSNFSVLFSVVNNTGNGRPSVAANAYGSGHLVATATYVGKGCYAYYPYDQPNVKFAFNVIAWASSFTHMRKNPRHSGSSIDTVGGTKLLESWSFVGAPPTQAESAAVIHKNAVFYSSGNTIFALDLYPSEDLDQDGNPDDGIQDNRADPNYRGQDLIWTFQPQAANEQFSPPTVTSAWDPRDPSKTVEVVIATTDQGHVYMIEAFPTLPTGQLAPQSQSALPQGEFYALGAKGDEKPNPPLYINGWVYAVDGDGRLHGYNPALQAWATENSKSAQFEWAVPTKFDAGGPDAGRAELKKGPSFGFVGNENSGAIVGMVYWYAGPWQTLGVDTERNDFVYGIPVYVSNDRLKVKRQSAVSPDVECDITYKSGNISDDPLPVVWVRNPDGTSTPLTVASNDINHTLTGAISPGTIVLRGGGTRLQNSPNAVVYASYALDYSPMQEHVLRMALPRVRAPLKPSSRNLGGGGAGSGGSTAPPTAVSGTPAMGSKNMLYLNATRGSGYGGSVYGLLNDGTQQQTRWNYQFHSGVQVPVAGGSQLTDVPPVVASKDPVTKAWNPMLNPMAWSSPAVSGDKVFVTVTGENGGGALLCFRGNPDFTIRIMENAGYDQGGKPIKRPKRLYNRAARQNMHVRLWQPNLMLPGGPTQADLQPMLSAVEISRSGWVDHDRGTVTFHNFDDYELRGTGMHANVTNQFTPSLPVWVYLDNVAVPIDFSTWGPAVAMAPPGVPIPPETGDCVDLSGWNNLMWYYAVPPYEGQPCSGIHSSPIVIGNKVYFVTDDAVMYALNAETGESNGGPTDPKNVVWQQKIGTGNMPNGSNVSPAGSNGVLVVPSAEGLHAFTNSTTLVADNNRVVELDGAGEVSWSVDTIVWPVVVPGNEAPPRKQGQVNKPARVRYVGTGELLLVNSGASQVAKIDRAGMVGIARFGSGNGQFIRWLYDKFADPKNLLRPGQPTQLQGPTDAVLWEEVETNGNNLPEMVIHCLVADSGNHRVLDLVYRIDMKNNALLNTVQDPNSGYYLPELNWVTKTDSMNQRYTYDCLQLVPDPATNSHLIWAAISNYATGTDMTTAPSGNQGLGGAIVALGYRKHANAGGQWLYGELGSGEIVARCDRVAWGGNTIPLASPRFLQVIDKGNNRYLLICDNNGVYKAQLPAGGGVPVVGEFYIDRAYRGAERQLLAQGSGDAVPCPPNGIGAPLVAMSVQELPNGNWLISNGYSGHDKMSLQGSGPVYDTSPGADGPANKFAGEVFEVIPSTGEIVWSSPNLTVPPSAPDPPNPTPPPDPRTRVQKLGNSYVLEQPRSAVRQF